MVRLLFIAVAISAVLLLLAFIGGKLIRKQWSAQANHDWNGSRMSCRSDSLFWDHRFHHEWLPQLLRLLAQARGFDLR